MAGSRPGGRGTRIDLDDIIQAAIDIGLDNVSMRAIARRLDVGLSSLYYHVEGVEQITRMVAEFKVRRVRIHEASRDDWEAAIRASARSLRTVLEDAPGVLERRFGDPVYGDSAMRATEEACQSLANLGFDAATAWLAARTVAEFVEAFVLRKRRHEAAGTTDLRHAATSSDRDDYPAIHAAYDQLGEDSVERRFDFGLQLLLRGLRDLLGDSERTTAVRPGPSDEG